MRMLDNFENMNLSRNTLNICNIYYLAFLQNFDSNSSFSQNVRTNFDLSKSALADCLSQYILTNFSFMRL